MRRWLPVVLLAAACTSGAAEELPRPSGDVERGGVLRIATTPIGSIDPGNAYEPSGELVASLLCEPLIGIDPRTGELRPALAEQWLVSDDGRRISLRLRKDLRFSDGSELTADDVAWTLNRVASADFASEAASLLEPVDGFAEVHGDVETDSDTDRRRLKGIRIIDERSVEIALTRSDAEFVRAFTSIVLTPVPRARAERDPRGFSRQPVCTGPYRLAEPYAPGGTSLRLERSDAHRPVNAGLTGGGAGYPDAVEVRVHPTTAAAAAAVADGDADVAPAAADGGNGVHSAPGPLVDMIGLAVGTAPFTAAPVRRALALALDREELVRRVFPGTRVPARGFLPPTAGPAYRDDACGLPPRGDLAAARALLAREGVDLAGVSVPLYVNAELRNVPLAREVARQWRAALGLTAVVTPLPFDGFVTRGQSAQGFDGAFRFSWSTPYPDPEGFLSALLATDRIGRDNLSRFSDPQLDEVLQEEVREAEDADDRLRALRRAEALACEQMPMVPLTVTLSRWVTGPAVASATGAVVDDATGRPLLRELYLRAS